MLEIPTKMLLIAAGIAWLAAGLGVASVGLAACHGVWTPPMIIGLLVVFALFLVMFLRISIKHTKRILGFTEPLSPLFKFFDINSYIIMAVMVGLGVSIRFSGLVPDPAIASFYIGLGSALLICTIYYIVTYVAVCDELAVTDSQ